MSRLARHFVPEQPQHVTLQGLRGPLFLDEGDYLYFLICLTDAARVAGLAIHAWVLMPDAVQFLGTPAYQSSVAMAMQAVSRRYVETFNRRHGRRGMVWDGRYRATVIEPGQYFLQASQLIDHAPVHAGQATNAQNYRWSSYAHHIGLSEDRLTQDHPLYRALGETPAARQQAYQALCSHVLDERAVSALAAPATADWVLGSDSYCQWAAQTANRRMTPVLLRDRKLKADAKPSLLASWRHEEKQARKSSPALESAA